MRVKLFFACCAIWAGCTQPALAINKCTAPDGKVTYQEAACAGAGQHMDVRPANRTYATTSVAPVGSAPVQAPATEAERINQATEQSRKDRRKRELETILIPSAQGQLRAHKASCAEKQRQLEAEKYRYVQNLYGKTHAAQVASEEAANASTCANRQRELESGIDALMKELSGLKEKP